MADPASYSEQSVDDCFNYFGLSEPDLLIRTGKERRISNYMLWHLAYTELVFLDIYWPDFNLEHFNLAIEDYQKRSRRYGLIEETHNS